MNEEEAIKILHILSGANGGCSYCVRSLFNHFDIEFPQFKYLTKIKFKKVFNEEL